MEFPEPWHSHDDWDHLEAAFARLNRLRRRKGIPPSYVSNRPSLLLRLDGEECDISFSGDQQTEPFPKDLQPPALSADGKDAGKLSDGNRPVSPTGETGGNILPVQSGSSGTEGLPGEGIVAPDAS